MEPSGKTTVAEPYRYERGIALLASLFVLMLLTILALAMMLAATTETMINQNFRQSKNAFYAAEGGLEEARLRLSLPGDPPGIAGLLTNLNYKYTAVYIRADSSINPTNNSSSNPYYDPEWTTIQKRDANSNLILVSSGLTTPVYRTTLQTNPRQVPYSWVKVTRKTEVFAGQDFNVDLNSANNDLPVYYGYGNLTGLYSQYVNDTTNAGSHSGFPVYLVTSMSLANDGSRHTVQSEVTTLPPEHANAAVDSYNNVNFQGNLTVNGFDECSSTGGGVVGVQSHGTVDTPNGAQNITGVPEPIVAGAPWTHDVPHLIETLRKSGIFSPIESPGTNVTCSGGSCSGSNAVLGSYPSQMGYYYASGNTSITSNSSTGYGILVVNGNLTFHGGFSFHGMIICNGTINFTGGGSDHVNIHGAIIAGQSITDTTTDLGGSINIQYNGCDISTVYQNMPMITLTYKDRSIY